MYNRFFELYKYFKDFLYFYIKFQIKLMDFNKPLKITDEESPFYEYWLAIWHERLRRLDVTSRS